MLTEGVMEDILEFIYSGNVHVGFMERAEDLIVAADYSVLTTLKVIAGRFLENSLSTANSISICHFAYEEDFLNLPSHEVEQWIASDDIHVSADDDVFKIILDWIDHDKNERKKDILRSISSRAIALCIV